GKLQASFVAGIIQSEFTPIEAQMFLMAEDLPKEDYILLGFQFMSKYLYFHGFDLVPWDTIEKYLDENGETEDAAFPDEWEYDIDNAELISVMSATI
ncbi:MAG: hypothetical protein ABEI13_01455, partial [Candidatus Paceibacteria bacterium]